MKKEYISAEKIIEHYSIALENGKKTYELDRLGLGDKAKEFGKYTADGLYEIVEWTYKRHLVSRWEEQRRIGKISETEFSIKKSRMTSNIHDLRKEMMKEANPLPAVTGINFDLLHTLKKPLRNLPVHQAGEVDLQQLHRIFPEVRKIIYHYVDSEAPLKVFRKESSQEHKQSDFLWDELFLSSDRFDEGKNTYILIAGKMDGLDLEDLKQIAQLPWTMVVDYDPESKNKGLFKAYKELTGLHPHFILQNRMNRVPFTRNSKVPYWYMAKGDADMPDTLVQDIRDWKRIVKRKVTPFFDEFAETFSKNVKVIVLHDDEAMVEGLCEAIYDSFENRVEFIVAAGSEQFKGFQRNYSGVVSSIPLQHSGLVKGIREFQSYFKSASLTENEIKVPGINGDQLLSKDDFVSMEEDLEILYCGIEYEDDIPESDKLDISFYKGSDISWYGLDRSFDIPRKVTGDIETLIKQKMIRHDEKNVVRVMHEPGVGGSTVARRAAWNLHEEYPTVFLKQFNEKTTAMNIVRLYRETSKTVLVFVELNEIGKDQVYKLIDNVRYHTISSIFILVQRRSADRQESSEAVNVNYLNDKEILKYIDRVTPFIEGLYGSTELTRKKKDELLTIYSEKGNSLKKSPFYLGLIAFEDQFTGIESYIEKFLTPLNETQTRILMYISMLYYYTGKSLPEYFFTSFLRENREENSVRDFSLEEFFPKDYSLESIIVREDNDNQLSYRPRHYLFAKEIMDQIMGAKENPLNAKQIMAEYAIQFIGHSDRKDGQQSVEVISMLRELFITRDPDEITNEKFSKLVTELRQFKLNDSIGRIFKKLAEVYPEEPHFLGHLARYYSYIEQNFPEALKYADEAINYSDSSDPVLHHIKGHCMKQEAKELSQKLEELHILSRGKDPEIPVMLERIRNQVQEAAGEFEKTRMLKDELPGYISHIGMLVDQVDTGYHLSGYSTREEFFEELKDDWYLQCIDEANSLLEQAKQHDRDGEDPYLISVEQKIFRLYKDYGLILRSWNNLLNISKTQKKKAVIRRQIVRVYEQMASGFDKISQEKLSEILSMLEENILIEHDNGANIDLWFRVARQMKNISIDDALDHVLKWKTLSDLNQTYYYYYVLKAIKGLNGSSKALEEAKRLIEEMKQKSDFLPNRIKVFEWLAAGNGINQLLDNKSFERLDDNEKIKRLQWLEGTVYEWKHGGHGIIQVEGLKVFFKPNQANDKKGIFDSDIGKRVRFCVGFSYDGLRAYDNSVKTIEHIEKHGDSTMEKLDSKPANRKLTVGQVVESVVVNNGPHHVYIKVNGVDEKCSIYHKHLKTPFSKNNRPERGAELKVSVLNYSDQHGYNFSMELSARPKKVVSSNSNSTVFGEKLQAVLNKEN
jgi:hypothetical protein